MTRLTGDDSMLWIKGIGACSVALIRNVRYMFLRLVHALAWTVRPPFRVD